MFKKFLLFFKRLLGRKEQPQQRERAMPDFDFSNIPDFEGSPEEALLLWQLPPSGFIKVRKLTSVDDMGQIPESVEFLKLTPTGKLQIKTTAIIHDDFGVIGNPENLKGQCVFCNRISFNTRTCGFCGQFTCELCGSEFEDKSSGKTLYLCSKHLKEAKWSANLWNDDEA